MGKQLDSLTPKLIDFIKHQKLFFVGTARSNGRVNLSPKGMDTLKVVHPNKVIWLNLTGSGNETAAHLLENDRMTIMFCSFDEKPLILRLYGEAKIYHTRDHEFHEYVSSFGSPTGARQIIELDFDLVQTSCGFGVPIMTFVEERPTLNKWASNKNEEELIDYWEQKNTISLDGHKTNII